MDQYSILMTVYQKDNPEYLKKSVASMQNQTYRSDDFVIVCDGPLTDELNEIVNELAKKDPTISVHHLDENRGLGAALRFGVPLCKNNWIARMDDDDISHLDRCEKEMKYLEDHPELSIVGSDMNEFDTDENAPYHIKKMPATQEEIMAFSKRRNPFNHSTVIFRKAAVMAVGSYSEMRTNQDVDLWVRLLNSGYWGENIGEALVDFRFNRETLRRRKNWKNSKLLIDVWHNFYKQKYCKYKDYLYVKAVQISIYLMPSKLLSWAYNHMR